MGKKRKDLVPQRRANPIVLEKKIDNLTAKLDLHSKNIDAITKSHDTHITMLVNFARHDIKNSVQSVDSILGSNSLEEFTQEHLESLKLNIDIIRETIDNFSKLAPHGKNSAFNFDELINAIESLNRENFYTKKITFKKEIPIGNYFFYLPFQSVLQMVNNIVINAIKAYEDAQTNKAIKITVEQNSKIFSIKIFDNAPKIPFRDSNSVFEYGVSSTGGSGIGLYHAKYLCDLYEGSISVVELDKDNTYSKYFLINLPINNQLVQ